MWDLSAPHAGVFCFPVKTWNQSQEIFLDILSNLDSPLPPPLTLLLVQDLPFCQTLITARTPKA